MADIGYARVSTREQSDDSQVDELTAAGCVKVFADKGVSGKLAARPELDACLAYMREGDVLVITRLSRAMRSIKHLLALTDELKSRGIGLKVLHQPEIDTTTSTGRLLFHILAAIDEFQRDLIVEGTHEGLKAARARGRLGGRKHKLTTAQVEAAQRLYDGGGMTVEQIAEAIGGNVARSSLYRYLDTSKPPAKAG